ncbi:MAG TPA: hypothetical protein VNG89_27175 [Vicinamibacterales bacterium]|nr:hypothetical protein [Vicinamibacterales bacterium]
MSRPRGVAPERVRLPLSDGDYVDVKRQLTAGEYRKLLYDQFKNTAVGEKVTLDHAKIGTSKLLAYILGWSFVSVIDQQPIPYDPQDPEELRRSALDDLLDPETYRELIAAVDAHEAREEAALEAQKKTRSTAPALSVTS